MELTETERRHLLRLVEQELWRGKNSVVATNRLHVLKNKLKNQKQ